MACSVGNHSISLDSVPCSSPNSADDTFRKHPSAETPARYQPSAEGTPLTQPGVERRERSERRATPGSVVVHANDRRISSKQASSADDW